MAANLRLATYNVEWFTELFDKRARFVADHSPSARYGITKAQQWAAIGAVFAAMDADGVMVIEAPDTGPRANTVAALERFARHFGLRARRAVIGYVSETEQEIAFLFDPDVMQAQHAPLGEARENSPAPPFDYALKYGDPPELIRFSKPPLEIAAQLQDGGAFRLIGVHVKSKAVHDVSNQDSFVKLSIQNRRKQLAECFWIRARVDQILAQDIPLLVMGDFNDGPGLDAYEAVFGHSSVEVVTGQTDPAKSPLFDPHAAQNARIWGDLPPLSSRFWLAEKQDYFGAMLDYIMASKSIADSGPIWRIWHPVHDAAIAADQALAQALLTASDHFPVTIDIPLPIKGALA